MPLELKKHTHTQKARLLCEGEKWWQVSPVGLVLVTFFSKGLAGLGQNSGGERHEKLPRRLRGGRGRVSLWFGCG